MSYGETYSIICLDTQMVYHGKTTKSLKRRLSNHVREFTSYYRDSLGTYKSSYEIIKNGNYKIVSVKKCINEEDLHNSERNLIKSTYEFNVNKNIPWLYGLDQRGYRTSLEGRTARNKNRNLRSDCTKCDKTHQRGRRNRHQKSHYCQSFKKL